MEIESWQVIQNDREYTIHRKFPDGTDVIIYVVKRNDGEYETWSSAESRVSGPNEHLEGKSSSLEDAISLAHQEALGWNEDLE